ncbi:hypothetical protein SDJN03_17434, partial [Cucurbita argyrosperma subsp. sororia]
MESPRPIKCSNAVAGVPERGKGFASDIPIVNGGISIHLPTPLMLMELIEGEDNAVRLPYGRSIRELLFHSPGNAFSSSYVAKDYSDLDIFFSFPVFV